jgi:DNA repair exonuclease SbcCD ATPase subunit
MKLEYVEVCGFRGFRDRTRFEFPAGFAVFSGRNGVGKSTVLDAVDFALTGTINKFSVKNARGGGLEEHIWWVGRGKPEAHYVTVGFIDIEGERFSVTHRRESGVYSDEPDIIGRLCGSTGSETPAPETLMQSSLIRDEFIVALSVDLPEQARFAAVRDAIGALVGGDHSERTRKIAQAAKVARDQQQGRVDVAQADLGRCLSDLTEARSAAERTPDVSDALRTIEGFELQLPPDPTTRTDVLRRHIVNRRQTLQHIEAVRGRSVALLPELTYLRSAAASLEAEEADTAVQAATEAKARADQLLEFAELAAASERESDTYAAHLTALLEHGSVLGLQDGHCPLCAAHRSPDEFNSAVESARARLAARGERLAASSRTLAEATEAAAAAADALDAANRRLAQQTLRRLTAEQQLASIRSEYESQAFTGAADDPDAAQRRLLSERDALTRLERALFTLEASSAADQVATLESRVAELRSRLDSETAMLVDADRALEAARQIDASSKAVANQILAEQFDTVMPLLKELYRRLRPHVDWTDIESDFGGKVRGSLNFTVGDGHNVQFLFSSGQRRAAGLAFLLAIHLSRRWCAWQSLLLDDPVQHIDDYRALNLVEVLAAIRSSGRQVIVAVEDTALADVLCRRLRSSIGEIGRRFELQTSKTTGSSEIASINDIYPMPREVLRRAEAS